MQLTVDAPELVASLVLLEPALQTAADAAALAELLSPLVELHHRGESAKAVHLYASSRRVGMAG